jgi:sensor domain CHASE-containing protein
LLNYSSLHLQCATASLLDVSALMLENKTSGTVALDMSGLLVSCMPLTASTNESVQKGNISPSTQ